MHLAIRALPLLLAASVSAQVELTMTGGSLPGNVESRLGPYTNFFPALIILSTNSGPTPLALLDNRDPRQLRVGLESLSLSFAGIFGLDGFFRGPTFPVPNQPWFVDRALYFQGVTLEGSANNFLIGAVSEPRAVFFAPAGTLRNRLVQMTNARAFFTQPIQIPGGQWLVAAGGSGALLSQAALASTEVFDPSSDAFSPGPSLAFARSVHSVTQLADGKWLFAAGVDTNNDPQDTSEVFDPVQMSFRTIAAVMLAKRMGHTASRLADGRVLVTGGLSDLNGTGIDPVNSALASTEIYNPVNDTWIAGPNMTRPRAGHIAIPLADGRILFAGGVGFTTFLGVRIPQIWNQTEIYNPATNTLANAGAMGTPRAIFSVSDLGGGRFLAAGGISSLLGLGAPTNTAEIYDVATNLWSATAGNLGAARGMTSVIALGSGRFLHLGGADGTLLAPNALSSTEIFDSGTGRFTPGPALNISRAGFGVIATPTGQVHVIGGGTGTTGTSTTTTEWYFR